MREDTGAVYMLPSQYPVTLPQSSQGDPRRSYPNHYLTGTRLTSEQSQYSSNTLGLHAPNLAIPSNAGYPMFDNPSAPLFPQRSHSFPQTPPFTDPPSAQAWSTVPVATQFGASSMQNHFPLQVAPASSNSPQSWPPLTSGILNDGGFTGFTSIGDESSYPALLSRTFSGTSGAMYATQSMLSGPSTLPQLQARHQIDTPSTQSSLIDLSPSRWSASIGHHLSSDSPTISYSPSLAEDHKPTRARRPAKLNLFNLSSAPELQTLASSIQGEAWFLNGEEERVISEREAERNLGPVGHSIFIAFLQEVIDVHTKRKTGWECRICQAANKAGKGDRYEVERLDRGLKHVRHHFAFKKFHCEGICGEPGCDMRFISKASLTAHQRREETPTCPECGMVVRKRNLKRHMDTACRPRLTS